MIICIFITNCSNWISRVDNRIIVKFQPCLSHIKSSFECIWVVFFYLLLQHANIFVKVCFQLLPIMVLMMWCIIVYLIEIMRKRKYILFSNDDSLDRADITLPLSVPLFVQIRKRSHVSCVHFLFGNVDWWELMIGRFTEIFQNISTPFNAIWDKQNVHVYCLGGVILTLFFGVVVSSFKRILMD